MFEIHPDDAGACALIRAYNQHTNTTSSFDACFAIYNCLLVAGHTPSPFVITSLLVVGEKPNQLEKVPELWCDICDHSVKLDLICLGKLVAACARKITRMFVSRSSTCLQKLLEFLEASNLQPTSVKTINYLVRARSHLRDLPSAKKVQLDGGKR